MPPRRRFFRQPQYPTAGSENSRLWQVPGNTGTIARTCAASAVGLHLIAPLGFQVDVSKLNRAGLDYWLMGKNGYWLLLREEHLFIQRGDWLVFVSEPHGLPPEALLDCKSEALGAGTIRIPMVETFVRCLNLSLSVGIAVHEASRQLSYEQVQCPPETCEL